MVNINLTQYKRCTKCRVSKPCGAFYALKSHKDGLASHCKECNKADIKHNMDSKRDSVRGQCKLWRARNKEHISQYNKEYALIDTTKAARDKKYQNKAYRTNIQYRIATCLRSRLGIALRGKYKAGSSVRDLGCSLGQLKQHLEAKFQPGMSWDSYGQYGWHIDHIKPLVSFDLTDRKQFLVACNYTNLQPLWAADNLRKAASK